ncbi:MAG: trigger factor, partial [Candidatus Saccharimonas sp.]
MKTSIKNVSETKVIATITVEANELEAARQVALKKFAKTVKVAGFRKGNAPLEMVAKNTDPNDLINETVNNALSKAVAEAFLENKVQVLDRPEVEVKKFVPFSELEFTAEADVLPKVTLGDYKKLKLKPVAVKIDKSDVDDVIERLQKGLSEKTETKDAAKDGDEVVLDFVGKQNNEPFEGGTAKDYPLVLGSGSFIPGFEEALVGHKTGESFDIPLSFP